MFKKLQKMRYLLILLVSLTSFQSLSQEITFNKSTLRVDEPSDKDKAKKETFNVELKAEKIPPVSPVITIQILAASTYNSSLVALTTTSFPAGALKAKNSIAIDINTDPWTDQEKYILLTANWTNTAGELKQVMDTLFIKNTYPFKGTTEKDYTDWNDGKRAEIFIGTNFDFINNKVTLSDWYGGARIFLPSITDFRFDKGKSNRTPRFGVAGGIYHAKSLSNFGHPLNNTEYTSIYGRVTAYDGDSAFLRYDTVKTKVDNEINNWGLYVAPLYQWSRYESGDGKFITNLYLGTHAEIIRRNISYKYTFDTIGTNTIKDRIRNIPRYLLESPQNNTQTFYDSYFGICLPVQFLWKDILDMKINPCMGIGSRGYTSQIITRADKKLNSWPGFYLVQFDLLARFGGIRLNIGGEVRGYFPRENPIITSYLGTSFSVQKLVEFVTK